MLIRMLITIGKVRKPHGLKGEIKIEPLTDVPGPYHSLRRLYLVSPNGETRECIVQSARAAQDAVFLLLEGYDAPELVRRFNGWLVQIPEEEATPLPEGRYYWFELIGMDVESETGEQLGRIVDIFETGSNDVYVMKRGHGEVYIPATKEIIKHVDRTSKRMVIHVREGLLEE